MFNSNTKFYYQEGYILFTVLFFILMIGLMVLSSLNTTHLELRMSQNYALASQQFQAAEAGLSIAEARLTSLLSGNFSHNEFNYAGSHVYYVIQRLELPFCIDQQLAYYYRITARAEQLQRSTLTLQTNYAKKINRICRGEEQKLNKEGRSAWRQLY